jgi:hypothetical protein
MASYTLVWEFHVASNCVAEFEGHYGPEGTWAQLFRRSTGYVETILLRDAAEALRYLTIDRWRSAEDYQRFRTEFASDYADLDEQCEALTTREVALGVLTEIA